MTEDAIYQVILANGPAGDNQRGAGGGSGNPSMIERVARRQAKAVMESVSAELDPLDPFIARLEGLKRTVMLLAADVAMSQFNVSAVDILMRCPLDDETVRWLLSR